MEVLKKIYSLKKLKIWRYKYALTHGMSCYSKLNGKCQGETVFLLESNTIDYIMIKLSDKCLICL